MFTKFESLYFVVEVIFKRVNNQPRSQRFALKIEKNASFIS